MPQHFHMSTGFLFVITLFVVAILVVILAFIVSMRRDRLAAEAELARIANNKAYYADLDKRYPNHRPGFVEGSPIGTTSDGSRRDYTGPGYIPPAPAYHPAPVAAYAPTTVMHNGGGSDMLTGMLVGNMLAGGGHGHGGGGDTYINNAPAPAYEAPDSGGMSWGSSDSSSGGGGCDFGGGD